MVWLHGRRPLDRCAVVLPLALFFFGLGCSDRWNSTAPSSAGSDPDENIPLFTDHTSPQRSALSSTMGQWSAPFPWVNVAVHMSVLPDGRVLSFGRLNGGTPQVWNPATGLFTSIPSPSLLFCGGQAFLPGGRLLVAGGHIQDGLGLPNANLFSFATNTWVAAPAMREGRWYPTATALADGKVLVIAGTNQQGVRVLIPEVWTGSDWRALTGASRDLPWYPRDFLAPNGQVFYAGELQQTYYLNTAGAGSWTYVADRVVANRTYGAAVMYRPGKILYAGGGNPPTRTAEVIDLNLPSPRWRAVASMANGRRMLNLTLLPDGRVLASGGTSASGFSNPAGAVHALEVWDPATERWTTWASNAVTRVYHSGMVLLPDGRLVSAGSGDGSNLPNEENAEIFEPPYLFNGPRPRITSVPGQITIGSAVSLDSPDAASITTVSLLRLNATTHSHDMNQRYVGLTFTRSGTTLSLSIPASKNQVPPGHYMLFILNGNGVPSVARMVRLK
jgi:galactose oxidase-like protein